MMANIGPAILGQRRLFLIPFAIFLSFVALYSFSGSTSWLFESTAATPAQNATLGFGAIYVLTENDSTWRVQGLRQAAKFTGLQLTIRVQQHVPDEEVYQYLDGSEATTVLDEIRAVMNYITLLETFIDSGSESALFMEDDVDFGLDIKAQMQLMSDGIMRHYLGDLGDDPEDPLTESARYELSHYPYGNDRWDVLWIGHYGIEALPKSQVVPYTDPYALSWNRLTSNFNNYLDQIRAAATETDQEQPQQILITGAPMGTYAFALSRSNAQRLVKKLRDKHVQQFDLALHIDCKGLVHRCVAPVPAMMHHHRVTGQKALVKAGNQDDGIHDLHWWRHQHKYTYNVEWSARCNAAGVGEKLGDRWQCMPGR